MNRLSEYRAMDYDRQIDEIMDHFNFANVAIAMKALQWKWGDEVPSEPEIRKFARNQLRRLAVKPSVCCIHCGGFLANIEEDGDLSLAFILEEWEADAQQ